MSGGVAFSEVQTVTVAYPGMFVDEQKMRASDGENNLISTGDIYGWHVAGAGDINADGYADVLVGAPYDDHAGPFEVGGVGSAA